MKLPHMQFYTGDWLKDPRLSLCKPATRGVWIDLLCAMHELDRSGELCGTNDELSRLARCSTVELESALTDLQNKLAAEVQNRNGSWVIANRRMKREAITREKRALAGSIGGSKAQANREQTPDIDNGTDGGLERVREFARGRGVSEQDAEWFYWKGRGNGWTNGGKPMLDWKATLLSWQRAGYLPSQKQTSNGNGSHSERSMSAFEIEKRVAACNDKINELWQKNVIEEPNGTKSLPKWCREEIDQVKKRKLELKEMLSA